MHDAEPPEFNLRKIDPEEGLIAATDALRARCPVARGGASRWYLLRHGDVTRVLHDHETFSNTVSAHPAVPNGMDPPEHTAYRREVEPLFGPKYVAPFEPFCRSLAAALLGGVSGAVEAMEELAWPFAAESQCAFLGWPACLAAVLADWTRRNQAAIRAEDRPAIDALAAEFDAIVGDILRDVRRTGGGGVMAEILAARVNGRPLNDEELASLLRNWTVGEIGTIAASIGILLQAMAAYPELQSRLRRQPGTLPSAIDEILRLNGPLLTNRRRATKDTEIAGCPVRAGDEVTVLWIAANRDEAAFPDAHALLPERDARANLLYGAGIHVCPGAPLARLEMRVFLEEALARFVDIGPIPGKPPVNARYPAGGYDRVHLRLD